MSFRCIEHCTIYMRWQGQQIYMFVIEHMYRMIINYYTIPPAFTLMLREIGGPSPTLVIAETLKEMFKKDIVLLPAKIYNLFSK